MAVRIITYDLNKEPTSADYNEILKVIKSYNWTELSESSYAVQTNESPFMIFAKLKPFLDENDHLLVLNLSKPYSGQHEQEVINWLDTRLPQ